MAVVSMTGFASVDIAVSDARPDDRLAVTLRSVNHRHLDLKFRLSRELGQFERDVAQRIRQRLSRGHVDISIQVTRAAQSSEAPALDVALAETLFRESAALAERLGIAPPDMSAILRLPGVMKQETTAEASEVSGDAVLRALDLALEQLLQMRRVEGEALRADLEHRSQQLLDYIGTIEYSLPTLVKAQGARLKQRVAELLADGTVIDQNRLETEVALLADKCDVSEEVTRVRSHLRQFAHELMREPQGSGKKLAFMAQELHREFNTIGSKVGDPEIISVVIDAKSELEKVREQVANLE